MATKKPAAKVDALAALAAGPLENVIAHMLWKNRHRDPSMTMVIRPEDIQGLADCATYLKVRPTVVVLRPGGMPATPAVPARGNRPGRPAMPAEPARPQVVVALVNKGTMDAITPLENNDADAELLVQEQTRRRWKSKAPMLAQRALTAGGGGEVSSSEMAEIAEALQAFAAE